jgi:hypothetical protein
VNINPQLMAALVAARTARGGVKPKPDPRMRPPRSPVVDPGTEGPADPGVIGNPAGLFGPGPNGGVAGGIYPPGTIANNTSGDLSQTPLGQMLVRLLMR